MATFTITDVVSSENVTDTRTQVRTVTNFDEVRANMALLALYLTLGEMSGSELLLDIDVTDGMLDWLGTDSAEDATIETAERTVTFSYSE